MTGFDIAVLLIVALTSIAGFMRGFVEEALALVAWILAVLVIYYFHTPVTAAMAGLIGPGTAAAILAFALLLLVPYAVVKFASKWVGKASRNSVLGPIDRVLGFGFGAIKGVIVVVLAFSLVILAYDTVWGPLGRPDWISQSRSYPFVNAASEQLVGMIAERHRKARTAAEKDAEAGR